MSQRTKYYSYLQRYSSFEDRFHYLALGGTVGVQTFGFDRWMNQQFYRSPQWRHVRDLVITRDHGRDLGMLGHEIHRGLLVHHMNPMSSEDIETGQEWILDPEFLITTCITTHNAIHYGDFDLLPKPHVERVAGDTNLW